MKKNQVAPSRSGMNSFLFLSVFSDGVRREYDARQLQCVDIVALTIMQKIRARYLHFT